MQFLCGSRGDFRWQTYRAMQSHESLAPGRPFSPLSRKPKRKSVVTIIVGIICTDGIAMACDSQTTIGDAYAKRTDTSKISVLEMSSNAVLVAEAGDATLSSRCVEILRENIKDSPFDDYRKPADVAQDAVRLMKQELVVLNNWEDRRDFAADY